MGRGAWQGTVHGMARVGHNLVTNHQHSAHPYAMQWAGSVDGVQVWGGCVRCVSSTSLFELINQRVMSFFKKRIMTFKEDSKGRIQIFPSLWALHGTLARMTMSLWFPFLCSVSFYVSVSLSLALPQSLPPRVLSLSVVSDSLWPHGL